jgi:hypothetical protein
MILVKSLIVILLMLILAKFGTPILEFLSKLFDGREGFVVEEEGEEEGEEGEREKVVMEESFYSPPSVLENHQKVANESKFVATLQDQMNELNQLSEKATDINNQLNFNNK